MSVRVVAHRGASAEAPENTLAAFERAIAIGADALECDVHAAADGTPMLVHDEDLARTGGDPRKVIDLSPEELATIDVGAWKGPEFRGQGVPRLVDLLRLARGRVEVAIELKHAGLEDAVAAAIAEAEFDPDRAIVFAWTFPVLERVGDALPGVRRLLLLEPLPRDRALRTALIAEAVARGLTHLGPKDEGLDPHFFAEARDAGLDVWVWTVDAPEAMRRLAADGAAGIISNRPALLLEVLGREARSVARNPTLEP